MALEEALVFIVLAVGASTFTRLLHRHVVKETDPYAYALFVNIVATVMFLPLALVTFSLPPFDSTVAWATMIFAIVLWSIIAVSSKIAFKKTDVSLKTPLSQSKLLWALILGLVFLGEATTLSRIAGTIIVFTGITLLIWHPEKKFGSLRHIGVRWTLFTAAVLGIVTIVDKFALNFFVPEMYAFLAYLGPTIVMTTFLPGRTHQMRHLLKRRWLPAVTAAVLGASTFYFVLRAFAVAEVTLVYPLLQLSVLLSVLGGIIILGEREHVRQKIIATVIVVAGAIVIGL